jgi:hypothetical protein
MPDLKLGLNDKLTLGDDGGGTAHTNNASAGKAIELDDLTFHQCVNLSRFQTDRCVSFVPPDGEFELMRYRISEAVQLPFKVLPLITVRARSAPPSPTCCPAPGRGGGYGEAVFETPDFFASQLSRFP